MRRTHILLAAVVAAVFSGNVMATPWFTDNFDSYADDNAFRAVWAWDDPIDYPGRLSTDVLAWYSPPNSWKMNKNFFDVRTWRSLIPAIQAVDPSKNAVNGTAANPLIVSFQLLEGTGAGQEEKVLLWLELVGQNITSGALDGAFSAPIKNPGSYGTDVGVCGPTNTCTAGWYKMNGKYCSRNADCDTPMWLDFISNLPSMLCTVLDQTLPVPRPSLAFGVYSGSNGLVPKGVPDNSCASLTTTGIASTVAYDGDRWSKLTSTAPPGGSATSIPTTSLITDVVLTIRDTDFDITTYQAVRCGLTGKCDLIATCTTALAGTCVNNVCTGNGVACTTDADCNFCSDDTSMHCTSDIDCRSSTCVGGPNPGAACTTDATCAATIRTCMDGPDVGNTCPEGSGSTAVYSSTCARKVSTKAHIPRKYLGAFQTLAIGPGHVYDGNSTPVYGSDNAGHIDSIQISGGELQTMPTGACCLPDGTCQQAMQAACEQIANANYAGDNVTCEAAKCDAGACCTATGCVADKTPTECQTLGGVFRGLRTTCDGGTCYGACCSGEGCLLNKHQRECEGLGGMFQGDGTTCENRLCCANPFADADWDGDVDQDDFGVFQICYNGSGVAPTGCECFDRNVDTKVDTTDFTSFSACFTGPNVPWSQPVTPTCTP